MVSSILGELDVLVNGVYVLYEFSTVFCLLDKKGVIHIPKA